MNSTPWKIEWSDSLSMRNAEIDAEHQEFIALANELNGAILSRNNKADIESILNKILTHSMVHFSHEEKLFLDRQYPNTQNHMQAHAELIIAIKRIMAAIHQTELNKEWVEMGLTIKNALINHILNEDTQYIEYLRDV